MDIINANKPLVFLFALLLLLGAWKFGVEELLE